MNTKRVGFNKYSTIGTIAVVVLCVLCFLGCEDMDTSCDVGVNEELGVMNIRGALPSDTEEVEISLYQGYLIDTDDVPIEQITITPTADGMVEAIFQCLKSGDYTVAAKATCGIDPCCSDSPGLPPDDICYESFTAANVEAGGLAIVWLVLNQPAVNDE